MWNSKLEQINKKEKKISSMTSGGNSTNIFLEIKVGF